MKLTRGEWETLLKALDSEPNPEAYDFGPAYESARRERADLARKVRASFVRIEKGNRK